MDALPTESSLIVGESTGDTTNGERRDECGKYGKPYGTVHKCPGCGYNMHPYCGIGLGEERHCQEIQYPSCTSRIKATNSNIQSVTNPSLSSASVPKSSKQTNPSSSSDLVPKSSSSYRNTIYS